jgi:hypothetical protein
MTPATRRAAPEGTTRNTDTQAGERVGRRNRREAPFVTIPVGLLEDDRIAPSLRRTCWAVYAALAKCRNEQTRRCNPSREKLAKIVGCSVGPVKAALRELERTSWIIRKRGHGATRATNSYTLHEVAQRDTSDPLGDEPMGRVRAAQWVASDPQTRRPELDAVLRVAQNRSAAAATDADELDLIFPIPHRDTPGEPTARSSREEDVLSPADQLARARDHAKRYGQSEGAA